MTPFFNTLYVTQPHTYLAKSYETVVVKQEGTVLLQVPLHHLSGIVCLAASIGVSPELMGICQEKGIAISWLSETGRFLGRVEGRVSGNVLLRREQYRKADSTMHCLQFSCGFIHGKISNSRTMLRRLLRENTSPEAKESLQHTSDRLSNCLHRLQEVSSMNELRGIEGEAAAVYFEAFKLGIKNPNFNFEGRYRRPPKDPVNAMLSYLYSILSHDCTAALASVGLDPQVGFLHVDRPGRPSLSLDLMEEFRSVMVDRLVLRLINLKQVKISDFMEDGLGGIRMNDDCRRLLLSEYQVLKREELLHPLLNQKTPYGLLCQLQAKLLAKVIRGEMEAYPPYFLR